MDCKSFLVLFSEEKTAEKRMEKGATKRAIYTPCNPRQPHFTIGTNFL